MSTPEAELGFDRPPWVDDAVIYGVLPPKFGRPPLRATTARLADLAELGVNTLWLAPVNTTIPFEAGYAVIDYFTIRSDFGSDADFRALITEAHRLGLHVLMDFVPNHTSDRHPYYLDVNQQGRRSPYFDFYDRDAAGRATHYFDWAQLPNLNFENPAVRRFMTEAMCYWVREFDVDGYRVDVAWGIRQRRPDYWSELRRALARIKPDVFLLAEASARDPYYLANGFDAAYDWTDRLGEWAWQEAWRSPDGPVAGLDAALGNGRGDPPGQRVFRFLNNNDTGERFIAWHGPGLTRVAATMLFTLPGIPGPYTGDEIGASFHPYHNLEALDWDLDPYELRPYYRRLITLRTELRSLRGPDFARVGSDPADRIYAYLRGRSDDDPVLVVLNYADQPVAAHVRLPDRLLDDRRWTDRLHNARFRLTNGSPVVELPGHAARILTSS